jgi:hypothetical protein
MVTLAKSINIASLRDPFPQILAHKHRREEQQRGAMIAKLISGFWQSPPPPTHLSEADLLSLLLRLCRSGAGALAWWRIRETELAQSPAGLELQQVYRRFRLSARIHEQEIKAVFAVLRGAGIEPVLVKGWSVARLYPDPGLRPYGDIDLCVHPDQFEQAAAALKCLDEVAGHYVDLHAAFDGVGRGHQAFRVPTLVGYLGGRKRPTKVGTLNTCRWNELYERSQLMPLGDEQIRILSEEDHLRILCLHLLRSGAWRPMWLCDVALAVETRAENFNWDTCLGPDRRQAEWVRCTVRLAEELLGARGAGSRVGSQRSEVRGQESGVSSQGSEGRAYTPTQFLLTSDFRPLTSNPHWLAPAVLAQWGRERDPGERATALPELIRKTLGLKTVLSEVRWRWDNPVRATARTNGRFNNWPRWPYQLGEMVLRSSELL